jgi:hypothetical protein
LSEDFTRQYDEILTRLFEDARSDPARWTTLADLIDDLPIARLDTALKALNSVDVESWTEDQKRRVSSTLRDAAARHLRFPDAVWAMPAQNAHAILEVAKRLEPIDPVQRALWLFRQHVELPGVEGNDWKVAEEAVAVARVAAVTDLWRRGRYEDVRRLVNGAEAPWTVGFALADGNLVEDLVSFIEATLLVDEPPQQTMLRALLMRTSERRGDERLTAVLADSRSKGWPPEWRALVHASLAFSPMTWESVAHEGDSVDTRYWQTVALVGRGPLDPTTVATVASNLVRVGNVAAAIDFLNLYGDQADRTQILTVLETASSASNSGDVPWDRLGSDVLRLIELLQGATEVDQERVAMLEWRLVPFLRGHYQPKALERKLSHDPQFFIEVLSLGFRARDEEPDPDPPKEAKALASRAYQLLWAWRTPPGLTSEGTLDASALNQWIVRARALAAAVGRAEIADIQMGEVMAYIPAGHDGIWPAEPLRDLIESLQSEEFDRGIIIGVANARGLTSRALGVGGDLERELASKYVAFATAIRDHWPRSAAVLNRIAAGYQRDARRMDLDADLERREAWERAQGHG